MKFSIEQIAIHVPNPALARALLAEMGAVNWIEDTVHAAGYVFGEPASNTAYLHFNYELGSDKALEFETLKYVEGDNWLRGRMSASVSHLGMHCSAEQLVEWRKFFCDRGYAVAQEVVTHAHTNPAILDSRRYQYVIFGTRKVLGVDLKFIVRRDLQPSTGGL